MSTDLWGELVSAQHDSAAPLFELFHENSKFSRFAQGLPPTEVAARMRDMWESLPYDTCPAVDLPPAADPGMSLAEAILTRHTAHGLRPATLTTQTLATLLTYAYGITRDNVGTGYPRPFRTAPSAGALFPLELYVHARAVEGLPVGLYHFNAMRGNLRRLRDDDLTHEIATSLAQSDLAYDSSVLVFITAAFERSTFKYGDRGYRFSLIEAGHVAQNLDLTATALHLGVVNLGGFFDRDLDRLIGIDGITHSTLYLVAIGEDSAAGPGYPAS